MKWNLSQHPTKDHHPQFSANSGDGRRVPFWKLPSGCVTVESLSCFSPVCILTVQKGPYALYPHRWPRKPTWADQESALAELWEAKVHLCLVSRLDWLKRTVPRDPSFQAVNSMKMVHVRSSTCTICHLSRRDNEQINKYWNIDVEFQHNLF